MHLASILLHLGLSLCLSHWDTHILSWSYMFRKSSCAWFVSVNLSVVKQLETPPGCCVAGPAQVLQYLLNQDRKCEAQSVSRPFQVPGDLLANSFAMCRRSLPVHCTRTRAQDITSSRFFLFFMAAIFSWGYCVGFGNILSSVTVTVQSLLLGTTNQLPPCVTDGQTRRSACLVRETEERAEKNKGGGADQNTCAHYPHRCD